MQKIFTLLLLSALVAGPALSKTTVTASNSRPASGDLITCPRPLPTADDYRLMAEQNVIIDPQVAKLVAPLEDTFLLHSNPGATQILYIDWDGHKKGGYKPWDMDGDPHTFSDAERTVIQQTWFSVSEDFLPFNIDVTTEEPPSGWLGQRAVVDGSGRYDYSWAYLGAWADHEGEIAYVYPGDDTWLWIADSITHEVGQSLNLGHDGRGGQEYYTGHGTGETQWCPAMGWGAYSLNTWSIGDYNGATNKQDDLAVITSVTGVDYRVDDHGDDIFSATDVTWSNNGFDFSAEGIISENGDVDFFAFSLSEPANVLMSINEDVIIGAANLDVLAQIHDDSGNVLHTSDPVDLISAFFDVSLPAGGYYLSIDGIGWGNPTADPPVGYSDYAILGNYSVSAMTDVGGPDVTAPTPNPASFASAPVADSDTAISMTATPGSDVSDPVKYDFLETSGGEGGTNSGWQDNPSYTDVGLMPATQYTYTVTMRDALGNTGAPSAPANATTAGCLPTTVRVDSMILTTANVGQGNRIGRATVSVVDNCGDPVSDVIVSGTFTGDYAESQSAVTSGSGVSVIDTFGTDRGKVSYTFCVDGVVGGGLTYAGDNVETCDSN